MERSRRRWVVWTAAGLGLLVLVGAAVAGRDSLLERWHLGRLESPDEEVRADAARRLGELRSARAVPRLLDLYTAGDIDIRDIGRVFTPPSVAEGPCWKALRAVGDRGVPALLEAVRGDDSRRALAALDILMALPALPATAAPVLVECMVKRRSLGSLAVTALGKVGPAGVEAALREPRARLFHGAVVKEALRARPEAFLEVLEVLRKEPRDLESLLGLADSIAGAGERILPTLSRRVEDQDPRVALLAARAILDAAESTRRVWVPLYEDFAVFSHGKEVPLAALQARASLPVTALARHLSHSDPAIRAHTAVLLGSIGPPALPALPALLPLLEEEAPETSMAAVGALGALGAGAVRPLLGVLKEAEARTRDHVLTVLVSLGTKDEAAVEALLEGLGHGDPRVASACASALGGVGALGTSTGQKTPSSRESTVPRPGAE